MTSLYIALDLAVNSPSALATTRGHFFGSEESLGIGLNSVHQTLCLEVRIEFHRGTDFLAFVPWPHRPGLPFGHVWAMVFPPLVSFCFCQPIVVSPDSPKAHHSWALHEPCESCLLETSAIVVRLMDWFHSHLYQRLSHCLHLRL